MSRGWALATTRAAAMLNGTAPSVRRTPAAWGLIFNLYYTLLGDPERFSLSRSASQPSEKYFRRRQLFMTVFFTSSLRSGKRWGFYRHLSHARPLHVLDAPLRTAFIFILSISGVYKTLSLPWAKRVRPNRYGTFGFDKEDFISERVSFSKLTCFFENQVNLIININLSNFLAF
jgi:hypothetical protein